MQRIYAVYFVISERLFAPSWTLFVYLYIINELLLFQYYIYTLFIILENLGRDIEENVQNSLRNFNIDLQSRVADFQEKVNREIDTNVAPLEGLGKRIQEQVYKSLEPVRAMELQHKMINGIGGTTITYINNGKYLFVKTGCHLREIYGYVVPLIYRVHIEFA